MKIKNQKNLLSIIDSNYHYFSKNQKILAKYIQENLGNIGFLSINEMSKETKISTATIIRFTRKIGFTGYYEFQKYLTNLLKENITPMKEIKNFIKEKDEKNTLKHIIDSNADVLLNMYTDNLEKNFNEAINCIKNNKGNIYIVGSRTSYSVAFYLYFMLKSIMENVYLLSDEHGDISLKLLYVKEEDKLITISYSRYSKFTYDMIQFFKKKKCKIISITDDTMSAIALNSDYILLAKNGNISYSLVGAMTLANSLVVAIGKTDRENTLKKMEHQDKIAIDSNLYIP